MLQQAWGSPEFSYLILNRFDLTLVLDFLVELVYRLWIFFFFFFSFKGQVTLNMCLGKTSSSI